MEELVGLLKEYRGGELLDRVGASEYPISHTEYPIMNFFCVKG